MKAMNCLPGTRWCRGGFGGMLALSLLALGYAAQGDVLEQVVLPADADSFLRGGASNTNEGGSPLLRVQGAGDNRVVVGFDQQNLVNTIGPDGILISAKLLITAADDSRNWGKNGDRTIDLNRLLVPWLEGNGINNEVPNRFRSRGTGPGVTWNMAIDLNINNGRMDPGVPWEMDKKGPNPWEPLPTGQSIVLNGITAGTQFLWDVTSDLQGWLNGSTVNAGWIVKKTNARQAGKILFCSREYDAFVAANPDQATVDTPGFHGPQLILDILRIQPGPTPPITLTATGDSFVRGGMTDRNEGGNVMMRLQASGDNRALVKFEVGTIPVASLKKASLVMTIKEMADNWGHSIPRTVSAHRLLTAWTEGNGMDADVPSSQKWRGSGPGVTWNCPTDTNIANTATDPLGGLKWKGGNGLTKLDPPYYAPATAPGVEHVNGMGPDVTVVWDVTQDVLAGAEFGWLVKKDDERQEGRVGYYTREGAAAANNLSLQPYLYLEYNP